MLVLQSDLAEQLRRDKFANVPGSAFRLEGNFDDFLRLTRSWEHMGEDRYFGQAQSGARFRRYSDFEFHPPSGELRQLEHRPYTQSTGQNRYVGGIERHFTDFGAEVLESPVLRSLIAIDFAVYKTVLPLELHDRIWQCQIHQIRIEIKPGQQIEITPEGKHSDGYPFAGVHFWGRQNVDGAQSQLFDADERPLGSTTYQQVLDTTFLLDREIKHYVSPARATHPELPGHRQIIAISFSLPGSAHDTVR
jgi:hypothetical protein